MTRRTAELVETPEQIIADATRAIAEAEAQEADLKARVEAGDESVTRGDLRAAEDRLWHLRSFFRNKERKAADLAAKQAADARAALLAEVLPILDAGVEDQIAPLMAEAAEKIAAIKAIAGRYNDAWNRLSAATEEIIGPWNDPDADAAELIRRGTFAGQPSGPVLFRGKQYTTYSLDTHRLGL